MSAPVASDTRGPFSANSEIRARSGGGPSPAATSRGGEVVAGLGRWQATAQVLRPGWERRTSEPAHLPSSFSITRSTCACRGRQAPVLVREECYGWLEQQAPCQQVIAADSDNVESGGKRLTQQVSRPVIGTSRRLGHHPEWRKTSPTSTCSLRQRTPRNGNGIERRSALPAGMWPRRSLRSARPPACLNSVPKPSLTAVI